jgi:hypothetical protein
VDKPTVAAPGETVEPNTGKVVQSEKACSITFQPKCRINPLVKYWDEVMECYTSPLRQYIGLDAPLQDRKYVVFQPDSGGWNNIRMALEVVILFAQVRYWCLCAQCALLCVSVSMTHLCPRHR